MAVLLIAPALAGCGEDRRPARARVAAGNTYIQCAVRDLMGPGEPVFHLAGPGMCPGHFDIRPSQVAQLRQCRVLLLFDFQKNLARKLSGEKLRVVLVTISGGLCEPAGYLGACRQVADALVSAGLLERVAADARLASIDRRMARCGAWATTAIRRAGLAGQPVLASRHQKSFCRFLGLKVAATFSSSDQVSVGEIERAVIAGRSGPIKIIVANLPEGRQVADALADRLGAKVAVLGNFPRSAGEGAFEQLVRDNVARVIEAAGR